MTIAVLEIGRGVGRDTRGSQALMEQQGQVWQLSKQSMLSGRAQALDNVTNVMSKILEGWVCVSLTVQTWTEEVGSDAPARALRRCCRS